MIRNTFSRLITGQRRIALKAVVPSENDLKNKIEDLAEIGIYLHIPFCDRICPYCPYNKEVFHSDLVKHYTSAVKREIDSYTRMVGKMPVTSFYIGGGTPTSMLHSGIEDLIIYIYDHFNMQCDIHMESHPSHLSDDNLDTLQAMGVSNLSIGVESLQDHHLKVLKRPYTTAEVRKIVERVVNRNFDCVNVDFMFALPNQTYDEVEQAGRILVDMGVDQVAAYPLFKFPYTKMGSDGLESAFNLSTLIRRRKMLGILEDIFYNADFRRSSVWAFTKRGVPKYCSVTVPLYIGLGASGGTYLKDIFYLNTFSAKEYINSLENDKMAIALSLDLTKEVQMAGWLYWRIYETKIDKREFDDRFGVNFDQVYGKYMQILAHLGFLNDDGKQIHLTDRGSYWMHAFEDLFSIDYISTLWGTSKQNPWPEEVIL
ncbi:MAG: radical SAM protein [Candidatus Marinimicrobia bacterium]|nr:radical SAM protein [Candidatus Neomarinimicrobiota bacterium]